MRRRTELALGFGAFALLLGVAAALGRASRPPDLGDFRASTYLTGPNGARGLADGLERLGVEVRRFRRRLRELPRSADSTPGQAFVVIEPGGSVESSELPLPFEWQARTGGDLVLIGSSSAPLMRCLGWGTRTPSVRALLVGPPGAAPDSTAARVAHELVPDTSLARVPTDRRPCDPVATAATDTILVNESGGPVVLRLRRADGHGAVVLMASAGLVRNRVMRRTSTGAEMLRLLADYRVVTFDEAVHGFGQSGSLAGAVLAWSGRSPWGWAGWQVAAAGLLALLAGAVRFGPARAALERRRRSPLEHVRALATALSAVRGHDVAVRATVRGLHRRLLPGRPIPRDPGPWLAGLEQRVPTPRARTAAKTLIDLSRPGQPAGAVSLAANAVEDLWEELHP